MSKRNQIDKPAINWFTQQYQAGRTVEEMSIDAGWSKQNVKRALAEGGVMYLSWYKTTEENTMLKYLKDMEVTSFNQLRECFTT